MSIDQIIVTIIGLGAIVGVALFFLGPAPRRRARRHGAVRALGGNDRRQGRLHPDVIIVEH